MRRKQRRGAKLATTKPHRFLRFETEAERKAKSYSEPTEQRSHIMSCIRSVSAMETDAGTMLRARFGVRIRHQPTGIFGKPDYANKTLKLAIFIHGCFWHQPCPKRCSKLPATNREFWKAKFKRNRWRHEEVVKRLESHGWKVITIWEHDLKCL